MKYARLPVWISLFFVVSSLALGLFAGCNAPSAAPPAPAPVAVAPAKAEFVGSQECKGCHPNEFAHQSVTGHARTLRLINDPTLADQLPRMGRIPNTQLEFKTLGDLHVVGSLVSGLVFPLQYVFGSGKQGWTFAGVPNDTTMFEMHFSYFPDKKSWYITPGHEQNKIDPKSLGLMLSGEIPRKCFLCHTDTLSENTLRPPNTALGVGCEGCHGAGSLHIAAKTKGEADLKMEKLELIGGKKMNALCGRCHRDAPEVEKLPEHQRLSQRFFPYGLAQSKCFQKSEDKMTCSTCHDPHTDVSRDQKIYETTCLQCHATPVGSPAPPAPAGKSFFSGGLCKVNPKSGCVPCHMPKRNAFPGTQLPIKMADHWIRANPPKS